MSSRLSEKYGNWQSALTLLSGWTWHWKTWSQLHRRIHNSIWHRAIWWSCGNRQGQLIRHFVLLILSVEVPIIFYNPLTSSEVIWPMWPKVWKVNYIFYWRPQFISLSSSITLSHELNWPDQCDWPQVNFEACALPFPMTECRKDQFHCGESQVTIKTCDSQSNNK